MACRKFIEDDSKGEQIGALINFFTASLFRRHIRCCSDCAASFRQLGSPTKFGQPEISDLDLSFLRQHYIVCFHIAMDNAMPVCMGQSLDNLQTEVNNLRKGKLTA